MTRTAYPTEEEKHKFYSTTEAIVAAEKIGIKVSRMTIIYWVEKHKLGFQPGGTDGNWFIHKDLFDSFINQKEQTNGKIDPAGCN